MFAAGDRVAWSHKLGAMFGADAVMKTAAVRAHDPHAVLGTVAAVENDQGTHLLVVFDAEEIERVAAVATPAYVVPEVGEHVLTHEELIKIQD